jgi:hypothetical protein
LGGRESKTGTSTLDAHDRTNLWIARAVVAIIFLGGGSLCQIALWLREDRSLALALAHWPLLWVLYLLVAVAIGERLHRWIKGLRNR